MPTSLIVLLHAGEIVIHVRRVGVVEEVGRQLPLQQDRFVSELTYLDEQLLVARDW